MSNFKSSSDLQIDHEVIGDVFCTAFDNLDIYEISKVFGLTNACYKLSMNIKYTGDFSKTRFLTGTVFGTTNYGNYELDFDKVAISWIENNNNNSQYTNFESLPFYTFIFIPTTSSIFEIASHYPSNENLGKYVWIKVFKDDELISSFDGNDKGIIQYSGNACGFVKMEANESYYIQTGVSDGSKIRYEVGITNLNTYTGSSIQMNQNSNTKFVVYNYNNTIGNHFRGFFNVGAFGPTYDYDTTIQIYNSSLQLIGFDSYGLWEDNGDDDSNYNAYIDDIVMSYNTMYYILVTNRPSNYNQQNWTINLEINFKGAMFK